MRCRLPWTWLLGLAPASARNFASRMAPPARVDAATKAAAETLHILLHPIGGGCAALRLPWVQREIQPGMHHPTSRLQTSLSVLLHYRVYKIIGLHHHCAGSTATHKESYRHHTAKKFFLALLTWEGSLSGVKLSPMMSSTTWRSFLLVLPALLASFRCCWFCRDALAVLGFDPVPTILAPLVLTPFFVMLCIVPHPLSIHSCPNIGTLEPFHQIKCGMPSSPIGL